MSLRRSPRRTPALLAANRANAQKSTGPRTAPGKQRSAANLRDFRGRSRRDHVELFAPPDPPELAGLDHPDDQGWIAGAADDLVRLRRRIRQRNLRRLRAPSRRRREVGA
jgi:hypothetical protein